MSGDAGRLQRELAEALYKAVAATVVNAHERQTGEHFYGYVLYTLPLFDYAILLFNTEEGLSRVARNEHRREDLRWSPPDWECAADADIEERFTVVNGIIDSLVQIQGNGEFQRTERRKVFIAVLKSLDAHGVFGTRKSRESAVVNIMWGDQEVPAHVESARDLNPKASYLAYARYALPSLRSSAKEIAESRAMNKEDALLHIGRTIAQVESDLLHL